MEPISRRKVVGGMAAGAAAAVLGPAGVCVARGMAVRQAPGLRREFRAVWVATVDNIDWPSRPGLSGEVQRAEIRRTVETAARLGLNAILLQVRPTSDALYRSDLEPWSAFLTGRQGLAPSPEYDPLEIWLDESHGAGLDLHAWVNPFRVRHPKSVGPDAPNHVANARPEIVRKHGPYLWLDPGEPEARALALRVIDDLLRRYAIDGIHMDDYFYPYPRENEPFPDAGSFARHAAGAPLEEWRRENINTFVRATRQLVHDRRPGGLFTVSPFGIWRPDHPRGVKGFDAYAGLHADSRRWLAEGWVDALMPQLYWPIESAGQPFEPLLDWWREQNRRGRHLWPGLYLTRIKPAGEEPSWEPEQIARQIEILRQKPDTPGLALFSMIGLLENRRGAADRMAQVFREPAVVPESPWLAARAPAAPVARLEDGGRTLRLEPRPGPTPVRRWAVQARRGDTWQTFVGPPGARTVPLGPGAGEVLVTAVGPNGVCSPAVTAI